MWADQRGRGGRAISIGVAVGARMWRVPRLAPAWERFLASISRAAEREVDRRRLFLWLPVFYAAGIAAYFAADIEPSIAASAIPLSVLVGLSALCRHRLSLFAPMLAAAMMFAGFLAGTVRTWLVAAPILRAPITVNVAGTVEAVDRTVYGSRIVVAVRKLEPTPERAPERIRVTYRGKVALAAGAGVTFRARLTPPGAPAVPSGFDFQREAYFQRLGAVGLVSGAIALAPAHDAQDLAQRLRAWIDRGRNALTERIVAVVGGSTGAIAAALVTGKRGEIAESDNENWRAAGIYHIISISGLHMMLAAGLFFWAGRMAFALLPGFSLRHATKKYAAVAAMGGVLAYDIFSGNEVATERALIMTLVMLGAVLVDRPAMAMRNLAISGMIVLSLRPETLLGPSFQMSFGAVAGLMAYGEFMRRRRERHVSSDGHEPGTALHVGRLAFDFAATSLIAGLATAPFQAFHFHRLNPYGLLGNTLAIPVCTFLVMPAAMAGVILYPLGLDAPAWWAMGQGVKLIGEAAKLVAGVSGATAETGRYPILAMIIMAVGLTTLSIMTTAAFRAAGAIVLAIGAILAGGSERPAMILEATGRSALVRSADGRLHFVGHARSSFAMQQWLSGDRDARAPRDPSLTSSTRCDRSGCTFVTNSHGTVAVTLHATGFKDDCERAGIIVTPFVAPAFCRTKAQIYDRRHFDLHGATYVYHSADGLRLETVRNGRQKRPWIPASAYEAAPFFNQTVVTNPAPPSNVEPPDASDPAPP